MSDETVQRGQATVEGGLSKTRLGRMYDVMAGHVERGGLPGMVTPVSRRGEVHVEIEIHQMFELEDFGPSKAVERIPEVGFEDKK